MKIFVCLLAFAVTVQCNALAHLETPLPAHSVHELPATRIINLIHEAASIAHDTLSLPLKLLKVIHGAEVIDLPAPTASPQELVKVIQQSVQETAPVPLSPPKYIKVIQHTSAVPIVAPASAKILRVIHEYAPRNYVPVREVQSAKLLRIVNQKTFSPVAASQNVKVYKVLRQVGVAGSGGITSTLVSRGAGRTYASSYSHGSVIPSSAVKVVKVLQKPALYSSLPRR